MGPGRLSASASGLEGRARPGKIVLFGSGEIAPSGRRGHAVAMADFEPPVKVAVLETPAGFELNSARVAGRVADFIRERLGEFRPRVLVLPARKRGTPFSPDDPYLVAPLLEADYIFMGPGSPTYAIRQLQGSVAWRYLVARHRQGAALGLASAAAIAVSAWAIPVYEIYKAGHDPHWVRGLDLFGDFGLQLAIVSHWNNQEGGEEVDTSRCFMGHERFEAMRRFLPPEVVILGIDEHTMAVFDFQKGGVEVLGLGRVTIVRADGTQEVEAGATFPINWLGAIRIPPPIEVQPPPGALGFPQPVLSPEAAALIRERETARQRKDWATADALRERLRSMGYEVQDTREGPRWRPLGDPTAPWQPL
ncbi:cysteinyl-tRNA synthetase [Thermoflexus sp.]|uniref:CysS/YqeB C-terminal domain-containing protein n=1 Tax=Thermoflexus sp. TaxID=1969742 RepID=UPI0035E3F62C